MTRFIKVYSEDGVGVIQFDRPQVLNALNREMVDEIVTQLEAFDLNGSIRSLC